MRFKWGLPETIHVENGRISLERDKVTSVCSPGSQVHKCPVAWRLDLEGSITVT